MRRRIAAASTSVLDPGVMCACGNHALWFMELHSMDRCHLESTVGQFFCNPCYEQNLERAQEIADDGEEICLSCGLLIVSLSDIIVRILHLEGKGEWPQKDPKVPPPTSGS